MGLQDAISASFSAINATQGTGKRRTLTLGSNNRRQNPSSKASRPCISLVTPRHDGFTSRDGVAFGLEPERPFLPS
jgi:hypothetical protein